MKNTKYEKTISEEFFEEYLHDRGFYSDRHPEIEAFMPNKPDYMIQTDHGNIVCELKELEDTEEKVKFEKFSNEVDAIMKSITLPFSISCNCSDICSIKDVKFLARFLLKHSSAISSLARKDDRIVLGKDYKNRAPELRVIRNEATHQQVIAIETESDKYPIADGNLAIYYESRYSVLNDSNRVGIDFLSICNYDKPLFEIRIYNTELRHVNRPLKAFNVTIVQRMRDKIKKARKKLRQPGNLTIPYVVVLFDKTGFPVDDISILQAMFGNWTLNIELADSERIKNRVASSFLGKDGILRNKNKHISAVMLLHKSETDTFVSVFHNYDPYIELSSDIFVGKLDRRIYVSKKTGLAVTEQARL